MVREEIEGERKAAAAKRGDKLVSRAAKRADWAGSALEGAAGDLADVGDDGDGDSLTGLAELVHDEAERVGRLAEDIGSHRNVGEDEDQKTRPGGAHAAGF